MALTGTQYQSMRLKFRGLIGSPFAGVSEAELDSFMGQLALDVTGSVSAAQTSQCETLLIGALASPAYTPVAADIALLFAQLVASAPAIIQALTQTRYQQLKNQLTGALSLAGVRTEAQMLAYIGGYLFKDPSVVFGASLLAWYRGDAVTLVTGVSQWSDKSGNGNHLIQATGGSQPAYTANDATLNNRGTLLGNGSSTFLNCVAMSVPATCFIWFVMEQASWVLNSRMLDWPAGGRIIQATSTPIMIYSQGANTSDNNGAPLGSWKRGYARLDNTTADAFALGSNVQTGVACGRTAATNNTTIFAAFGGAAFWNGSIADIVIVNRLPTGPELAAIDAYGSGYYLPSVLA